MTWADFKRLVEKQLADGKGDDEEVLSISWNGLEEPVVIFETKRRGKDTQDIVYIA